MLIPFLMFSLDSDQGKVKYSPLDGRGSKVTILVGRHFQSEMLPIAILNQKCCQSKDRPKKPCWDTFLFEIFHVNQKMHFFGGLPYPPQGQFYDSAPTGGTKPTP